MSVDFGWNADDKIRMNPSRSIGSPCPQVTMTRLSNCDIFDFVRRVSLCYGTIKSESENLL